ncbi:NAD-dependent epimerase/dehydratase family protein [Nocardia wallacei]|uniref:NAD-dependent epimerase/dehydratase family protein n=1 Tax=Nocardia wallacei TaxID=480035 RepID=UPI0024566854|nr:NAD-dependent epimerase/dehydratase family protein [Nocardia wallacei]
MKIVITGATGNVGTALIRALAGTGDELVGIARRCPPSDREAHAPRYRGDSDPASTPDPAPVAPVDPDRYRVRGSSGDPASDPARCPPADRDPDTHVRWARGDRASMPEFGRRPPPDRDSDAHVPRAPGGRASTRELACGPPVDREPETRVRWVSCDIGDPASAPVLAAACAGADAVVHLAWAVHPRRDDPPMARTNAGGSARVLRAAAAAGVRQVVCASSAAAYRPGPRWQAVDEGAALGGVPGSAYSLGKVYLEAQLDEFERREPSIRVARIRPCGIGQAEAAGELAGWLLPPWLPRALIGRRWLPVPLWKDLRLQLVHADDVAAGVALILRRGASGAFNLAAEPVLPAAALADSYGGFRLPCPRRAALAVARASWRLGLQPLHPGWLVLADRARLVDATRARRDLGWSPRYDAAAVCAELAAAMRADRRGHSAALDPARLGVRLGRPTHQSQDPPP